MRKFFKTIALVTPLLFIGCGDDLSKPTIEAVKGGELFVNFSGSAIKPGLVAKGLIDENRTVYGYKAYKIPYMTTDEEGNKVKVSGLFVIPTGLPEAVTKTFGLSMVSDDHGTIFANKEAPSVIADFTGAPDGSSIILTSLGGFATLQPDYIGFGDSKGDYHPFLLKDSLANSTVDFIKKVKVFAKENNIKLNNQLFLTGYSEGGYASLATLKKIEEEQITELKVSMTASMAGPHALKLIADAVFSQPKLDIPAFTANIVYAYAKANNQALTSVVNKPYASSLQALLNGDFERIEIDPKLTQDTTGEKGLLTQSFVTNYFKDESNWFRVALIKNSLHTWAPTTPLRLVHCEGDRVIPYGISQLTEATMKGMGATNVALIPVEKTLGLTKKVDHVECGALAYSISTKLFSEVRKQTIGY